MAEMDETRFEQALEEVMAFLAAPPPEGTPEDRRFTALLEELRTADVTWAQAEEKVGLSAELALLRSRIEAAAAARAERSDPGEGIGPTLGMDLGGHADGGSGLRGTDGGR